MDSGQPPARWAGTHFHSCRLDASRFIIVVLVQNLPLCWAAMGKTEWDVLNGEMLLEFEIYGGTVIIRTMEVCDFC